MSSSATWSDDRVTHLRRLWVDGLSAAQIARSLGGVTRNAVIGKVHRLGIAGRASPSSPGKPRAGRAARPVRRQAPKIAAPAALRTPRTVTVEEPGLVGGGMGLSAHVCRWPIGDPKAEGFSFCGRPAVGVYCRAHAAVGIQPVKATRLERDPVVWRALAGLA
ncbi:MAG: hypothetical protein BGN86_12140 [Caulobacterales bacterium 68-7]|nr:GcrA cell cycle regulator [Caulobacterales bacterium]OJU11792.1 MAG: hypothetical protein BGN86_12140 [Caulobacterales bacterium 68-7]